MARPEKVALVDQLTDKLKQSQSVVLADFKGLSVLELTNLRNELRKSQIELKVIKNRLAKRAIEAANYEKLDEMLKGNTIWAFGLQDAAAPAKILVKYAKENEKLVLKGGLLEGRRLDAAGIGQLSKMPGRKELLSQMAGGFKQPAAKMASVMQAALSKVVYAFSALEKKQGGGEAAAS